MNAKIISYLGFAIRARMVAFGVDDIEAIKKGAFLILIDESLGESSKKTVQKSRERLGCPLIIAKSGTLGESLHRPTVKAVAVKDFHLASAILKEMENERDLMIQQ